jgi:hypothetical protein
MTSLLQSPKLTGAFVLWSGYIVAWTVVTGPGLAVAAFWWLTGVVVFRLLWLVPTLRRRPAR